MTESSFNYTGEELRVRSNVDPVGLIALVTYFRHQDDSRKYLNMHSKGPVNQTVRTIEGYSTGVLGLGRFIGFLRHKQWTTDLGALVHIVGHEQGYGSHELSHAGIYAQDWHFLTIREAGRVSEFAIDLRDGHAGPKAGSPHDLC